MSDNPASRSLSRVASAVVAFAALAGVSAVALGAWASHGAAEPAKGWLATASTYQMVHAAALLGAALLRDRLATDPSRRWPRRFADLALAALAGGVVLFCGGLIALSLGTSWGPFGFKGAAPAGGLLLMAGWLALALAGLGALWRRKA